MEQVNTQVKVKTNSLNTSKYNEDASIGMKALAVLFVIAAILILGPMFGAAF